MFGKRQYVVGGNSNSTGKYIEIDVWASTAKQALEIAQQRNDGVSYTNARKKGCGCGGS